MRIKKLKTVADIKQIHNFIGEQFKISARESNEDPFPMMDTYNEMIENLETRHNFFIKAEITGVLAGCAIALNPDFSNKSIFLRAIVVKKYFQKQGIARKLLKNLEKMVKSQGFTTIKVKEREGSNGFFIRAGYIPYLYVIANTDEELKKAKEINNGRFSILEEYKLEGKYIIKFDIEEEAVYTDKKKYKQLLPNAKTQFIYEKKLK